jgi:hypothetical protein
MGMMYTIPLIQAYLEQSIYANEVAQGKKIALKSYAYSINGLSLAPAATSTQIVNIQANADFLCTHLSHHANLAGAAQTVSSKVEPLIRLLITDSASNEQWTNQAIDLACYSTNDAKLMMLPYPRFVGGRAQINLTFTSYEAANTDVLDFVLHGLNIYLM